MGRGNADQRALPTRVLPAGPLPCARCGRPVDWSFLDRPAEEMRWEQPYDRVLREAVPEHGLCMRCFGRSRVTYEVTRDDEEGSYVIGPISVRPPA